MFFEGFGFKKFIFVKTMIGGHDMFQEEFQEVCKAGVNKSNFLRKNPLGYFLSSVLAGGLIALGGFVAFTAGSIISVGEVASFTKIVQAIVFASALSLIVMAGAELFTGNNFVMASTALRKQVNWSKVVKLWVVCWSGNLIGSVLFAVLFQISGVPKGDVGTYFANLAQTKMAYQPLELFVRAMLCNMLVCLATWCSIKMKSESGKLIMVFWCIIIFMICGFEHSVANMSVLAVGLMNATNQAVSIGGYVYNVITVSLGNLVGSVLFVAIPYHFISKEVK